jgi:hypothetical protein
VVVDLNLPDSELTKLFDDQKAKYPELYNVVKTTVYGSFYLAGPRTLFEKNPEDFESQLDARKFQALVFGAIPQIKTWQQGVVQKKYTYGSQGRNWGWSGNRLYNPFGYSIELWDLASEGPQACAFLPQSTIGSAAKESMLQLWDTWLQPYMILQIHDELVFDVPELPTLATPSGPVLPPFVGAKTNIEHVMGQPWPQLRGLRIPVETKISEDMS